MRVRSSEADWGVCTLYTMNVGTLSSLLGQRTVLRHGPGAGSAGSCSGGAIPMRVQRLQHMDAHGRGCQGTGH